MTLRDKSLPTSVRRFVSAWLLLCRTLSSSVLESSSPAQHCLGLRQDVGSPSNLEWSQQLEIRRTMRSSACAFLTNSAQKLRFIGFAAVSCNVKYAQNPTSTGGFMSTRRPCVVLVLVSMCRVSIYVLVSQRIQDIKVGSRIVVTRASDLPSAMGCVHGWESVISL